MLFYQGVAPKGSGGEYLAMWGQFAIAIVACAIFLFLPGYCLLRIGRLPSWFALACAPLVSIVCYSLLCTAYGMADVFCSWISVFLPVVIVGVGAYGLRIWIAGACSLEIDKNDLLVMATYVLVGVAVTCGAYICQLTSPDAFIQSWDNVHHLDAIMGFVDSGRWSSMGTSLYLGQDALIEPLAGGSFYPSAWYALAAMVVSLLGVSVPFAENVVNFTIIALAFPLGTYALLRAIFGNERRIIAAGSLFTLANASCPWMMLTWGPLYPNVMANCFVPAVMCAFVVLMAADSTSHRRVASCVALVLGALSFVFIQPNGLFTAIVLLTPYFVTRVFGIAKSSSFATSRSSGFAKGFGVGCAIGAVCLVVVFWAFAFNAPFMQSVVQYRWPHDTSLADAFMDVAVQRFHSPGLAIGCALILAVGIMVVFAHKRHRWLVASWMFACTIYVVCVSSDGFWHQFLAGFWYTDTPRIAAFAAFSAVPLQAVGFSEIASLAAWPFRGEKHARVAASGLMVVIVAALLFVPATATKEIEIEPRHFTNGSAFAGEAIHLAHEYSFEDPRIYDEAEREFVRDAIELMPEGSLVVNEPNDGTAYAYGVEGLRTYYRYWRGYGSPNEEKPESAIIREHLCEISSNDDVSAAVKQIGATYVLQLERGERSWKTTMWVYDDGALWRGIDGIDEDTPGFELVLKRDDMRLYKIVG